MSASTFNCASCMETIDTSTSKPVDMPGGTALCENCFTAPGSYKGQFEAVLLNQCNHPVVYGGHELKIENYARFFDSQFLEKYEAKLREYAIPLAERVWCGEHCGTFIGRQSELASQDACTACSAYTCKSCTHSCRPAESGVKSPWDGLKLGVEIQFCSGCRAPLSLIDGCHLVTCSVCKVNTCYACGKQIGDDHAHFDRTKTPNACALYPPKDGQEPIYWDNLVADQMRELRERHMVEMVEEGENDLDNIIAPNETAEATLRRRQRQVILHSVLPRLRALGHGDFAMALETVASSLSLNLGVYTLHQIPMPLNNLSWRRRWSRSLYGDLLRYIEDAERLSTRRDEIWDLLPELRGMFRSVRVIMTASFEDFAQGLPQAQAVQQAQRAAAARST